MILDHDGHPGAARAASHAAGAIPGEVQRPHGSTRGRPLGLEARRPPTRACRPIRHLASNKANGGAPQFFGASNGEDGRTITRPGRAGVPARRHPEEEFEALGKATTRRRRGVGRTGATQRLTKRRRRPAMASTRTMPTCTRQRPEFGARHPAPRRAARAVQVAAGGADHSPDIWRHRGIDEIDPAQTLVWPVPFMISQFPDVLGLW